MCVLLCVYFSTLARGIGGGLRSHKHVLPRRIFSPVLSQESLACVSLILFLFLVSCVQFGV